MYPTLPHRQVERLRKLSKKWRRGDAEAFRSLNKEVAQFSPDEFYHVRACVRCLPACVRALRCLLFVGSLPRLRLG